MVKKIGNILLLMNILFMTHSWCAEPISVSLALVDEVGNATKKTGIMIPVIIEVTVNNSTKSAEHITIQGLEKFKKEQLGTTQHMNSINGVTTRKTVYRFRIRTQQEGHYIIGPAQVTLDNSTYASEKSSLTVTQQYVPANQKVGFEIIVGKQTAFVGQKVPMTIRFYANKSAELIGIEPIELEKFKLGAMQGPLQGTRDRSGRSEGYLEWQTYLIPLEPGNFVIPAVKAYYKEHRRNGFHANFFSDLFDIGQDKSYVYSNSVNIHVDPLPPYKEPVHALGEFNSLQASVNQHEAKEGEGVVLTLKLEGDGNLEDIKHPQLHLPEELVYYESQSKIVADNKKIFEYIVQARKEGVWEVPVQRFTFFDVAKKKYTTLTTEPIVLTIKQGDKATKAGIAVQEKPEVCQAVEQSQDTLLPLNERYEEVVCDEGLSRALLIIGFWLPVCILLLMILYKALLFYRSRDTEYMRRKRAYTQAKKQIKLAVKEHDVSRLYAIFVSFVAMRYNLDPSYVSAEIVKQKLVRFSQSTVAGWEAFFAKVTEQAYAPSVLTHEEKNELFKNAYMWLALFEKSE